jgi:serine-type D-Ala-D-Ala carboxypeptidase/endopeptidase (penicillin-binding protein 4)
MRRRTPHGGWLFAAIALLCLSLLLGAIVVYLPNRIGGMLGLSTAAWHRGTRPNGPPAVLSAAAADAPTPTANGLATALAPLLADPALGGRPVLSVVDVATGQRLYEKGGQTSTVPASTTKLLTATAVLWARGPAYRISTRVLAGRNPGEVVLVGGGDPTLTAGLTGSYAGAPSLDELAKQVKQALGGTLPTQVIIDASLFTGPAYGPGWDGDIPTGGFAAPITALMIDGGRTAPVSPHGAAARSGQPDLAAGQAFAAALGLPADAVTRGGPPAGAYQLGEVKSAPLVRLVDQMLTESDNVMAECLARQVAMAKSEPATFAGAATAMKTVLSELGLAAQESALVDGSGLSRQNRVTPSLLTTVLTLTARPEYPQLHGIFGGLPVAGYSGTLRDRYRKQVAGAPAAGLVRAKTGTLSGVSAVAGIAVDADGRVLAFAIIAEGTASDPTTSQEALDRVAAGLAACGCR